MDKNTLIKFLNEALQFELYDTFLYAREADMIKGEKISKEFERFSRMELRHADNVAMQILVLGGSPKWEFMPLNVMKTTNEMLLVHLEREKKSVESYNKLIEFTNQEGYEQLRIILRGINSEEENHLIAIKELLKNKKIC